MSANLDKKFVTYITKRGYVVEPNGMITRNPTEGMGFVIVGTDERDALLRDFQHYQTEQTELANKSKNNACLHHPHKSTTHKERYFHFRIPNHPKVQAATVFARHDGTSWGYAVAFCSVKDKFEKRVGRIKARRRYFQGGGTYSANIKGCSWFSDTILTYEEVQKHVLIILPFMIKDSANDQT